MAASARPSLVVNISKLLKGDPNKATKMLEEDAKQLFKRDDKKTGGKGDSDKKKSSKKVFECKVAFNFKIIRMSFLGPVKDSSAI